jgi:hypothetical protein
LVRGGLVFVDQPAEELSSADLMRRCREWDYVGCVVRSAEVKSVSLVAASGVVMLDVLGHYDATVPFAGDEHPVRLLSAGRP